ncbi:hypothetical protein SAMN06296386_11211 [Lachnospiraceae bacterium]|nr:hypothetical protein SAMN06296386_11211 [Lachnospiraceae bacterium]
MYKKLFAFLSVLLLISVMIFFTIIVIDIKRDTKKDINRDKAEIQSEQQYAHSNQIESIDFQTAEYIPCNIDEVLEYFHNEGYSAGMEKYQYLNVTGRVRNCYATGSDEIGYEIRIELARPSEKRTRGPDSLRTGPEVIVCTLNNSFDKELAAQVREINRNDIITVKGEILYPDKQAIILNTSILMILKSVGKSVIDNQEIRTFNSRVDNGLASDYLNLTEEEQKEYIALYTGCDKDNLYIYEYKEIDGGSAALYAYIDNNGDQADFLLALKRDGTVKCKYPDGVSKDAKGILIEQ